MRGKISGAYILGALLAIIIYKLLYIVIFKLIDNKSVAILVFFAAVLGTLQLILFIAKRVAERP